MVITICVVDARCFFEFINATIIFQVYSSTDQCD